MVTTIIVTKNLQTALQKGAVTVTTTFKSGGAMSPLSHTKLHL